jgi:RHS family protein
LALGGYELWMLLFGGAVVVAGQQATQSGGFTGSRSSAGGAAVSVSDVGKCNKPPEGKCPPCKTVSGKIIQPKTLGYRPLDIIPNNVKQHGVYGSHHNIFEANQMPYPKCDCFWAKQKYVLKPNQLKSNMVPVEPFVNN